MGATQEPVPPQQILGASLHGILSKGFGRSDGDGVEEERQLAGFEENRLQEQLLLASVPLHQRHGYVLVSGTHSDPVRLETLPKKFNT